MSVAFDLSTLDLPAVDAPPARLRAVPDVPRSEPVRRRREATVAVLRAPQGREVAAPVRLTRRGVVVLALAVAAVGAALVWWAALSAPDAPRAVPMPAAVTVHSGDTLWSIASRYAGDRDPRAVVADIESHNHLIDAEVVPGQVLHLR